MLFCWGGRGGGKCRGLELGIRIWLKFQMQWSGMSKYLCSHLCGCSPTVSWTPWCSPQRSQGAPSRGVIRQMCQDQHKTPFYHAISSSLVTYGIRLWGQNSSLNSEKISGSATNFKIPIDGGARWNIDKLSHEFWMVNYRRHIAGSDMA